MRRGFRGLADICQIFLAAGPKAGAYYIWSLLLSAPAIIRTKSLAAADAKMSQREWSFRYLGQRIIVPGAAFSVAREMCCRNVYGTERGFLPLPGETVVDVGANEGLFSIVAAQRGCRVIAIEAQSGFAEAIAANARRNGCSESISVVNALLGGGTGVLSTSDARAVASHWTRPVDEAEFDQVLDVLQVDSIDLLKMDIEGSEFDLLKTAPAWLPRVRRLVLEVHTHYGDASDWVSVLAGEGFAISLFDAQSRRVASIPTRTSGYIFASR